MVVSRVQHDRDAEPRQQRAQVQVRARACSEQCQTHHRENGGRAAVHDRRAEAPHDPGADPGVPRRS